MIFRIITKNYAVDRKIEFPKNRFSGRWERSVPFDCVVVKHVFFDWKLFFRYDFRVEINFQKKEIKFCVKNKFSTRIEPGAAKALTKTEFYVETEIKSLFLMTLIIVFFSHHHGNILLAAAADLVKTVMTESFYLGSIRILSNGRLFLCRALV